MSVSPKIIRRVLKPAVFLLLSLPALLLALQWARALSGDPDHGLTANPIEFTNRYLGDWALRWIVLSLAVTPLSVVSGSKLPIHFRRMAGLFAFSYALLHLSSYIVLDQFFDWQEIWGDIVKRNFITIGMISFVMLLPLAATSTNRMIKRLGARRWRLLHRLIYLVGPLVALHYLMMVKGNQLAPRLWAAGIALLLLFRLLRWLRMRRVRVRTRLSQAA
jgi:sulfoxide reductase heme-binding subunit YedZ